jgi:hypothetical protein
MQFSSKANLTELYLDCPSSGVDSGITLTIDVFDGNMASGTETCRSNWNNTYKRMEESGILIIGTELKQSRKNIKDGELSTAQVQLPPHDNNEDRKCQSCDS